MNQAGPAPVGDVGSPREAVRLADLVFLEMPDHFLVAWDVIASLPSAVHFQQIITLLYRSVIISGHCIVRL